MACKSIAALSAAACQPLIGGVFSLYLIAYKDLVRPAGAKPGQRYIIDDETGIVSGLQPLTGKNFVKINSLQQSAGASEELTTDATSGASYFTQTITFKPAFGTAERQLVLSLVNNPVVALLVVSDGTVFAAGLQGQLTLSALTRTLGTAPGDGRTSAYTLTGIDGALITEVLETLVNTLIVDVTAVTITGTATAKVGATSQLTAITTPTGQAVTWTSDDDAIATVDATGKVTGVKVGSTTIYADAGGIAQGQTFTVTAA